MISESVLLASFFMLYNLLLQRGPKINKKLTPKESKKYANNQQKIDHG